MVNRQLQESIYFDQSWLMLINLDQIMSSTSITIDQHKLPLGGVDQPLINFD